MNLDSLTNALSHIGLLVASLTKKNLNSSKEEIQKVVCQFGGEAERHLYRVLIGHLEWSGPSGGESHRPSPNNINNNNNNNNNKEKESAPNSSGATLSWSAAGSAGCALFVQHLSATLPPTHFIASLAFAVANPPNPSKYIKSQWVAGVCKVLRLTRVQEIKLCLHLLQGTSLEIRNQATTVLKAKLPELVRAYVDTDSEDRELLELSTESLHLLLIHIVHLWRDPPAALLPQESRQAFISALQQEFPRSRVPVVLAPLLYPDTDILMEKITQEQPANMAKNLLDGSLADLVRELGYSFCSTVEECRSNLGNFCVTSITPAAVAKVLGVMVRTHTGLPAEQIGLQNLNSPNSLWSDTKDKSSNNQTTSSSSDVTLGGSGGLSGPHCWNVEVFIKALLEVVPSINVKEVFNKLDHKGFLVKDRQGLKLLITALRCLLQGQGLRLELFPVECFYQQWKNTEEQLNLFTQILRNPEIFCLTDFPCHLVSTDSLKTLPELDNKEVATWKSVQLIDTLLYLGENHYTAVKEIFKFPIQHCPDILVLGLIQATLPYTILRQDLIASLIPIFLGNHPNAAIILHHAWHTQNNATTVRQIIMHAMAEWYMMVENDQTRLSRILDVAQDLKALSLLLNAQPFPFVIDLACLAYRREFLKLDKWLTDKIREHGEAFISACVKFLQRRCPHLVGGKEDGMQKSSQLPPETMATILVCLNACALNVSQELSDTIVTMVQHCNLMNRPRTQQGVQTSEGSLGGIASSLSSLNLGGGGGTSSIFPTSGSSSMSLGSLGSLGTAPGSPGRPLGPSTAPGTSQSPLSSILPALQLGPPHAAAVGSQLPTLPTSSIIPSSLRSHSVQPTVNPPSRQMDMSQIFDMPQMVSKEVEDEANSYFQRIYNHPPHPTLSIEEVLDMLKKFHESTNKREREVYSCMLRNLFEEYRFFPTYPDKELFTTARLFGGIIEQGLVEYMALGVALRYVMEALQKPHGSKMYYFGIVALDRFRSRLKEYPRYCQHLMAIQHFNEFPPHLIEYIKYGTQSQEPPSRPSGVVLPPSMNVSPSTPAPGTSAVAVTGTVVQPPTAAVSAVVSSVAKTLTATTTTTTTTAITRPQSMSVPSAPVGSGKQPTITTTNIETLLVATEKEEKITPPPEHMQDKIAFIFNNLSQVNLPQKCEELREVVSEEYWVWVAQYLVMKRASIENNFHTLYSLFLDQLKMNNFNAMVCRETLRNIKVLLRADKSAANFSDKSLLKNLGHWLGMLTLAKNKPILYSDIDMKSLLVESYNKGLQEMQYVIPFVAKVMESCAKSRVFKPPNPWTIAIMNVLAELHKEPDMKLHLKFEIEVLCNKLEINLEDLKPANILNDRERIARLKPQLSQPGGSKRAESTPLFPALQGFSSSSSFMHPMNTGSRWVANPNINHAPGHEVINQAKTSWSQMGAPGQVEMPTSTVTVQSSSVGATPTPPSVLPPHPSSTPTPIQSQQPSVNEPRFIYSDITVTSLRGLEPHISVSVPQVGGIASNAQLKQLVRHAVEMAVQEIVTAVLERSIKIAITTAEHIIKKDFALDPDESRMRVATHHMVRNLTAAMAMITCRDYLATNIAKSIKQGLMQAFSRTNQQQLPQQLEQMEQLAAAIAQENVGIACAFIQKTAAEKAVIEMDKRLAQEYEVRKAARTEGRRYCDAVVLTYQAERMPEPIRLKVGGVTQPQMAVYEEFARNIPGFLPITDQDTMFLTKPVPLSSQQQQQQPPHSQQQAFGSDETTAFLLLTERISAELEHTIQAFTTLAPSSSLIPMLHSLREGLLLTRTNRDAHAAQLLLRKAVENLLEGARELPTEPELSQLALRFRDCHLIVLKAMADHRSYGTNWTSKNVTKCWAESREELKYNLDVVDWLIRSNLLNMQLLDEHLARTLDDPRLPSYIPSFFIMQLVQIYLVDDPSNSFLSESDLQLTLEALVRMCHSRQAPEGLVPLIDALRLKHDLLASERLAGGSSLSGTNSALAAGPSLHFHSGVTQARDFSDPPALQEKTEVLLREWIQMYHSPTAGQGSASAFQHFVKQMNLHGILKTDDLITRFFRICISMCRDLCVRSILEQGQGPSPTYVRSKCFQNLDAFVRLIALLVKHSGEATNPTTKINLLNKVLGLVCGIMIHDIESNGTEFQQLPYHRILIMLFLELNAPEAILESINLPVCEVLMAFTQTLHLLRPSKCPGFAYAWLEIVSHRVFIGRMLAITPQQKGWSMYSMLLADLFKFLAPFLRNAELAKPLTMLYKGTLRVLLVLLHDFPEFLCEYHYGFCDVIPPNCIQMRNLILSAFPRNMRLPDPFTPNLKVDMLPEITVSPKIPTNVASLIQPPELKKNLDSYLKNRTPVTFLSDMRTFLQVNNEPGMRYNMSVMNALVLYVGMQAIAQIHSKGLTPSMSTIAHSAHMDIFQNLGVDLDTEGRYLFLNAIANQLRYPNSHTHYFSCTLLHLFAEANTEAIQEQITRVLLERLIVNRPHPWGLLITFIELIKNPSFKFWSHEFVKCAPEIEKLFESVARSCMVQKIAPRGDSEA
ncbi:CCR4-NOT transcription complex subunit 1-like isoform X4 [Penaeus japonicus]|uniref:CCR4-NOT transcription complex subunit 1-like isoform X4 n=1 Tax=Penaeus japonicus TaxID=27405 RepID=UPI001C70C885|nr:CCR4-NOT transcription complex subunit 1-like isoform X4 [Penaeus japonicus]